LDSSSDLASLLLLADPTVLGWAGGLFACHVALQVFGTTYPNWFFSTKPGLVAHQLVIAVPFLYAAILGTALYLYDADIARLGSGTYVDRMYGWTENGWGLLRFMIGFQLYDLLATAMVPSLRVAQHLLHHGATLLTALSGADIQRPLCLYYCIFFFGIVEISSVPLVLVDLFRQLPNLTRSRMGGFLNEQSRTLFAVSFLLLRGIAFPAMMLTSYWPDLLAAYMNNDIRCSWLAYGWGWLSSSLLTCLQLFWTMKIIRVLAKGNVRGRDASAAHTET